MNPSCRRRFTRWLRSTGFWFSPCVRIPIGVRRCVAHLNSVRKRGKHPHLRFHRSESTDFRWLTRRRNLRSRFPTRSFPGGCRDAAEERRVHPVQRMSGFQLREIVNDSAHSLCSFYKLACSELFTHVLLMEQSHDVFESLNKSKIVLPVVQFSSNSEHMDFFNQ